jgi:hypothetical protein
MGNLKMKQAKILLIFFCSIVLNSCTSIYQIKTYNGPEIIELTNYCDLDEIESGEFISTIAYYTGIEEYWGLTSNNNCLLDHQIYLNTEENYELQLNEKLNKKFTSLYNNYWKYSLKLRIVGKLEKTNIELGYGHLGLQKIQIIPYQIEILGKQKFKN